MSQTVTSSVTAPPAAAPGPSATTANPNTGGTGSGTILLPHPSPSLSAQAVGQLVRAVVDGPTSDGKVIVDTRYGKFALPLPSLPPAGTVLQLQIVRSGTPVELLVLGATGAHPSPGTARIAQPPPGFLTLTNGELVRGIVVSSTPGGQTVIDTRFGQVSLTLPHPAAAGSSLQLQIVKAGVPLEVRLVGAGAAATAQGSAARSATAASLRVGETVFGRFVPPAGGAKPAAGLTATGFHARIVALHAAAPNATASGNEAVISGKVVATQSGGPTVIETVAGRIVLPHTAAPGDSARFVTLQILAEPGTVLPTNPGAAHLRALLSLSQPWTALADMIDAVRVENPQLAAQFSATALPNTGVTMTSGMALFLALLSRGQMPEWLGQDLVRLLETTNRQPLLNRLGDDFSQMARLAGEPMNGEWRVAMLPLLHDGVLHQVRMYLRERHGGAGKDSVGTRFVIEAALSHLGNIQLDGLVRHGRFDLMVRTQQLLSPTIRADITALFDHANEAFGVQGRINFQVHAHFPVDPVEELPDHAVGVYA